MARRLRQRLRGLPSKDPYDPGYRRLRYIRYADDHLLGFAGPKTEAEQIKQRLAEFLRDDLKLELNEDKTLVTHARTGAARFLGYDITVQRNQRMITRGRRSLTNAIALRVPTDVVKSACARYTVHGKPERRTQLMNDSDYTIISIYGAEYRGIVQYYLLAGNIRRLHRLTWVMVTSLLKTLAGKHHSTVSKMARRYRATIETPYGPRRCFQARVDRGETKPPLAARFGGIPLRRKHTAVLIDRVPGRSPHRPRGTQLIARLRRGRCEVCDHAGTVEVHHIRRLADLTHTGPPPPPAWMRIMTRRRRKTLVVCQPCHHHIHPGRPTGTSTQ